MDANKLERKQIAKEINNVIENGFNIDASHDEDFLKTAGYSWDDLNKLKEELGGKIIEFMGQVNAIITNRDIIANLGDKAQHFNKVTELFFSDINNFSFKVRDIRVQHEQLTGHIDNLNDFNNYNRIAIQYQSLFSELATLLSPTLADLVMTVSEIVPVNVNQAVDTPEDQETQEGQNHE